MSDSPRDVPVGFAPKWNIPFLNSHASLVRPVNQPIFDDDPDGLVIFGDSTAIYLARIGNPGQGVYAKLPTIKATTFIHGWALDAGKLYVIDGAELAVWDLGEAVKRHTVQLVSDQDAVTARAAWGELKKAIQSAEWATLLEQAEDEWTRLTPPQPEFLPMLEALRAMVGSANTSTAARQKIAELRSKLADKRKAAAPWCFSPPVVRRPSLQEAVTSVFVMQGNGMLHAFDKQLGSPKKLNWGKDQAELHVAVLDDHDAPIKRIAFVADSTLFAIDAIGLEPTGHWSPATAPGKGTTRSLTVANGQFWWSTENGVYACKPDETTLQLTWQTGPPWTARQVGRSGVPQSNYNPPPDPNELFDSMNVHAWVEQRQDKSAPLNDGMAAQLLLSDENGKYVTPPTGTSHVIYGPFAPDSSGAPHSWGEVRAHGSTPLVLISDSHTTSMLCRYPTPGGITQLLPQWVVAPWLSSVTRGSATDLALSQAWAAPTVRALAKPQPNMVAYFHHSTAANTLREFEFRITLFTKPERSLGDRELRYVFWWAIFDHPYPDMEFVLNLDSAKKALHVFYTDAQVLALRTQFAGLGTVWDFWGRTQAHADNFSAAKPAPDFDPPWLWKTHPSSLFHKPPPAWYDPWGYNRPGDFIAAQPAATYLDPFCFNGQPRFPQRSVPFDHAFKGQQWTVFADNDPPDTAADTEVATEPGILIIRTDEDHKLTNLYLLSSKRSGVTYNSASHELHSEAQPFASINDQVLGVPGVFVNAAWCVASREYPSARLHKIAAVDPAKSVSLWDTFVTQNRAKYGPSGSGTAWNIEECPLPSDVLPAVVLYGYLLPH